MSRRVARRKVWRVNGTESKRGRDWLAVEEPLEIRLQAETGDPQTIALTMRTPSHDYELVAGFLLSEGIIASKQAIGQMRYCVDEGETQEYNVLLVQLRLPQLPDLPQLTRHFVTNSACGLCGSLFLDDLAERPLPSLSSTFSLTAEQVSQLPALLRQQQATFEQTGGLHGVGLFGANGRLLAVREDIGRHNALDKLIGWALLNDRFPLTETTILVSGRASYELVQKCVVAGVSVLCAVSAPSSLAVATAQRFGLTLVGFVRNGRFNIYTHPERITN